MFRWILFMGLLVGNVAGYAQITSTFNANAQGWTTPNDADATIGYSATGGNPGGMVFGNPFVIVLGATTLYVPFNFVAPGAYLGNRSAYYNGTLRYDIQQNTTGTPNQHPEVTIADNGGITIYYFPATSNQPPAAPAWATYSVVFNNTSGFWKTTNSATGPAATELQIQNILSDLATLQIRGLYREANTISRLDNVIITPPIIINTQPPATTSVCAGVPVSLTTTASGNPGIAYQWQILISGFYTNLNNGGNYSGVTTNTLSINTIDGTATGNYRCTISGTNVVNANTNNASVIISTIPNGPTTTGASSCLPAALTLNASGLVNGQYRWYNVPAGGTILSISSAYTTPVISTTTTYYVAIFDGACESTRTSVAATINTPPGVPITTNAESCPPASVTLTASGAAAGQYRWYTVPTGGTAISGQTNSTFITPVLSSTTTYYVAIHNGTCESARSPVVATIATPGCDNVPPEIATAPLVTQIEGIVTISLLPLISDGNNNVNLSTLRIVTPPASGATATIDAAYNLIINYTSLSFSGIENITIEVCDLFLACAQQTLSIEVVGEIIIYNALSPGNDGKNDFFRIQNIELLEPVNTVTIYNRWGDLVWEGIRYDNTKVVFTGMSNKNKELPSGTYFYKIEFLKSEPESGYLVLKR